MSKKDPPKTKPHSWNIFNQTSAFLPNKMYPDYCPLNERYFGKLYQLSLTGTDITQDQAQNRIQNLWLRQN